MDKTRPRCGYVDTSDGQVHYRRAGDGPPLVLLHPTPLSSRFYEPALPFLANGANAIALDTPGYGASTRPPGTPRLDTYLRGIAEAMDGLGLQRVALCGFSTGAALAGAFAHRWPERVSHLILSNVPYWELGEIEQFKSQVGKRELGENGEHLLRVWNSMRYIAEKPELVPQLHMAVVEAARVYDHYLDGLIAVTDYDLRPELAAATCPILLLSSADDKLRAFTERAAAARPDARYAMLPGTHSHLPWTAPALFADHVLRFLGENRDVVPVRRAASGRG